MAANRSWRLLFALSAHRIERRLGRHLTQGEFDRLASVGDPLQLRALWLSYGGWLEARDGRLELSRALRLRERVT